MAFTRDLVLHNLSVDTVKIVAEGILKDAFKDNVEEDFEEVVDALVNSGHTYFPLFASNEQVSGPAGLVEVRKFVVRVDVRVLFGFGKMLTPIQTARLWPAVSPV